jgi:hypothetical protein
LFTSAALYLSACVAPQSRRALRVYSIFRVKLYPLLETDTKTTRSDYDDEDDEDGNGEDDDEDSNDGRSYGSIFFRGESGECGHASSHRHGLANRRPFGF